MKILLIVLSLFVYNCSSSETVVKQREISVVPKPIDLRLPVEVKPDTVIAIQTKVIRDTVTNEITKIDTVVDIRYFPKEKVITAKIKPDTVHIVIPDTVKQKIEVIQETSFLEKLGYMFLGVVVLTGIFFLIKKVF